MSVSQAPAIHPLPVRLSHWVNAVATMIMMTSGWQIYNAYPILPFRFPSWSTLGGWLGGALLWHFAAMWLLVANGLAYLSYGLLTGRLKIKLLPVNASMIDADLRAAITGHLAHADPSVYNAVQKLAYLMVLSFLVVATLSGLAIWKPVQLDCLSRALGGFQGSRVVHFAAMFAIGLFVVLHVSMSLVVPRSLVAMIRGR